MRHVSRTSCAAAAASLFLAVHCAEAATFPVTSTADSGPGSLRQAIADANANAGDDIVVFDLPGPGPHTIDLLSGLSITTNVEVINEQTSGTILEPVTVQRSCAPGTASFGLLFVGNGTRVTLAGLTLRNGSAGAISSGSANLALRDCVISGNTAPTGAALVINTDNGSFGPAGITLLRCAFLNNTAQSGGAIFSQSQNAHLTVTAQQCVFQGNTAAGEGGAIHVYGARTTSSYQLTDCSLSGNTAAAGGALFLRTGIGVGQAHLAMNRSIATANSATGASGGGGAIRFGTESFSAAVTAATIENCTFDGNEAHTGGAIDNGAGAQVSLRHVTIAGNRARSPDGGGLYSFGGPQSCQLWNSIVATNTSAGANPDVRGVFVSRGYNFIGAGDGSSGGFVHGQNNDQVGSVAAPLDPRLGPLADNGGPTFTRALLPGSPALDQGNSFATTTDQRGSLRPHDMAGVPNASGGDGADIGAYEVQGVALAAAASRKTHGQAGVFDISLPLTGESGVECRSSDGNHSLVFTFTNNLASGSASVTSGVGSIQGSPSFNGRTMTVNLTGVSDVQRITVATNKVTDEFDQSLPESAVSMDMLLGDINASKAVTASDIGQVKASSGSVVTSTNFRADVAVSGGITASDIGLVKLRAGQSIP